ncbi:uncharacterized protein UV8b_04797 [Ustilaginoidea virens]|uniref:Man(5)GlcNAc(2)-PP-dolichol translocation protein RFT1 n=1 Tax=Ustilaginoidea virens TaxID=1159556 RepID=A0A8E5MIB8_USTVR|nr:uncharacterized protein UV8b_04797 [Ustilaginoidea virens]QUC20556.1 hypothetical protein UV8b_04797 [Ustilaginoidea virens]
MARPRAENTPGHAQAAADAADAAAAAPLPAPSPPSMVKAASLLILLQLASRLLTFVVNQLLLRFLTAPLLGVSTQLEVYYLSVLFFAREALRVAIQRQSPPPQRHDAAARCQAVVNLGYLAVLLGSVLSAALGKLYMSYARESRLAAETPYLTESVYLYGAAALTELLSEPCFVLMQARLQFGTRAAAESVATLARCAVVLASAVWASSRRASLGVLPFALGQLTYGAALLLVYLVSGRGLASALGFSLAPRPVGGGDGLSASYFCKPTVRLAASMTAQSVVKHVLTQGDTFLVSLLSTPAVQGTYALANNYGGLVARLVLQPVEESSRRYFSSLLAAGSAADAEPAAAAVEEASRSLRTLARLYLLLSAIVVGVGPPACPALLAIVAGRQWSQHGAGDVLGVYCYYVPFLALNGLAEAFVASVATEAQIHRQSVWMGAFSLAFAASAVLFMRVLGLGAQGLILANMVNMLCRIVWSAVFIRRFFAGNRSSFGLRGLVPAGAASLSLCTLVVVRRTGVAATAAVEPFPALAKMAASAVPLVAAMAFLERRFLVECARHVGGRTGGRVP